MNTVQLQITGMSCGHCSAAVTKALKQVPGVTDAQVFLTEGIARVQGSAAPEALIKAVADEGYGVKIKTGA
ncbi:MAG: cation transporter [Pseudomonadota bacterium]